MKRGKYILLFVLISIMMISITSAGLFDWVKKITGKASTTGDVDFNISIGTGTGPIITLVSEIASLYLEDGPSSSVVTINFSVADTDGESNINDNSAKINITNSGIGRVNNTACAQYEGAGNEGNFTCNVTMWWFDSDGAWIINISISDNNYNNVTNDTGIVTVNSVTGFVSGPGNLTFATLQPGTTNQTPSNWLTLNNTGNQGVSTGNIQINATDLKGETTSSQALWANNFSVGISTAGAKPECDLGGSTATNMTGGTSGDAFVSISSSILAAGNYSINNAVTGQENLYICIQKIGLGLSQQSYSTSEEGPWTVKIV